MKRHKSFLLMLLGLLVVLFSLSTIAVAQDDEEDDQPPFPQQDRVVSPELHPDNSVTFRLDAPEADMVTIRGQWMTGRGADSLEMNDDGIWEITLGPITPDYFGYTFSVDGVRAIDPSNPLVIRDVNNNFSVLLVPGEESDLYMVHEVPHGKVAQVWYDSPTLGMERRMYVYTPPGYEDAMNASRSYPVLYLLHGAGGDESAWTTLGRTPQILDNLIARGDTEPMIVVMPNGNPGQAAMPGEQPYVEDPEETEGGGGGPGGMASGRFEQSVVDDIIPFIESHYRVIANDDNRAVAGLSMGGAQTQTISFSNPDMFNYVGVMSMGLMNFNQETDPAETRGPQVEALKNSDLELYWIGIGEEDFLYDSVVRLRELLDDHDFEYTYVETTRGHEWINWRKYLSELAPQLFQ